MSIRKLEPGELIDPSIYCGKNGIKVKSIERNSFSYPEQKDYLFKVGYTNGFFCLVDINGHAYQNADYDLQVIIESPEPVKGEWGDVVENIVSRVAIRDGDETYNNLRNDIVQILQQSGKPKVTEIAEQDRLESVDSVVNKVKKLCEDWGMPKKYTGCGGFTEGISEILRQCDKLKVDPVTVKMWVNVYDDGTFIKVHRSRKDADNLVGKARIACKEIEFSYVPGENI